MSLIREIKTIDNGLVSSVNSTSSALGAAGVFTGDWEDTLNYNTITIGILADQSSAVDGLEVQWSADGLTEIQDDVFSIFANAGKVYTFSPANRYFRVVYTNGAAPQASFSIQSILKKGGIKASSHRLKDSVIGDDDAELIKAVLTAADLNGVYSSIGQFKGALNVHQSDVHQFSVNRHFTTPLGTTTTLSTASLSQDIAIQVANTAGFAIGSTITINDVGEPNGAIVTAVAAGAPGTLTLDRPLDNDHALGTVIALVSENIAALTGTLAAPVVYSVGPPPGEIWHILRIMISSTFGSAADDSKFGDMAALPIGMVLRQNLSTGHHTISNWKSNADMKRDMHDVPDNAKAGGGLFGMSGRWTFKKTDFVPELIGDNGDTLEILSQDPLTLTTFEVHAQGHKVGQ